MDKLVQHPPGPPSSPVLSRRRRNSASGYPRCGVADAETVEHRHVLGPAHANSVAASPPRTARIVSRRPLALLRRPEDSVISVTARPAPSTHREAGYLGCGSGVAGVVGKTTIYRWWPGKALLAIEAAADAGRPAARDVQRRQPDGRAGPRRARGGGLGGAARGRHAPGAGRRHRTRPGGPGPPRRTARTAARGGQRPCCCRPRRAAISRTTSTSPCCSTSSSGRCCSAGCGALRSTTSSTNWPISWWPAADRGWHRLPEPAIFNACRITSARPASWSAAALPEWSWGYCSPAPASRSPSWRSTPTSCATSAATPSTPPP